MLNFNILFSQRKQAPFSTNSVLHAEEKRSARHYFTVEETIRA